MTMQDDMVRVLQALATIPRNGSYDAFGDAQELQRLTGLEMEKLADAVAMLENDRLAESSRELVGARFSPTQITPRGRLFLEQHVSKNAEPDEVPGELVDSLKLFVRDHPDPRRTGFIVMPFGSTPAHGAVLEAVCAALRRNGLKGVRADDKEYHTDLLPNVRTYMHGCGFGVAVFERIESDSFNPNVSLEVGYLMALGKPVCLLKERTLRTLTTDLVGRLYREFDVQTPQTVDSVLSKWLSDRGLASAA